jgi:hypothetical protein
MRDLAMDREGGAAEASGAVVTQRRVYVRWSDAVAERLLARLAAGEFLYRIARDDGMPTPEAVAKWAKERPAFGERLRAARAEGGRPEGARGPVSTFCTGIAAEICERVCEGESLTRIGADPTMPSLSTIQAWRRANGVFDEEVRQAKEVMGERFCDVGWALAEAATPETAYLTHVKLTHARWMAGVMAPRVARLKPMEPEKPRQMRTILFRHFKVEVDEATGEKKVVSYCPNPITGQVEREDTPGWTQSGDRFTASLPGNRKTGEGR